MHSRLNILGFFVSVVLIFPILGERRLLEVVDAPKFERELLEVLSHTCLH